GRQGDGPNADVAEAGVALLVARGPHRRAVVGDQCQVDPGDVLPQGGGLLELLLPGVRGEPGVEGPEQGAGRAADAGPVGHEAVGDPAAVGPLGTERGGEQQAWLESFQVGAEGPQARSRVDRGSEESRSAHRYAPWNRGDRNPRRGPSRGT